MATENPRVWFKSISLENVRSFGPMQTIYFTEDGTESGQPAQWNVILGDNGTGKTTVLRSLACAAGYKLGERSNKFYSELSRFDAVMPNIDYVAQETIQDQDKIFYYNLTLADRKSREEFDIKAGNGKLAVFLNGLNSGSLSFSLFAYGATRRIGDEGNTESDEIASLSLFSDDEALINAEVWFYQTDYAALRDAKQRNRYELVRKILLELMRGEIHDISIDVSSGAPKVFFKTHYGSVRFHDLNLGYKTLLAWMVDFAKGLLDRYPNSPNPLAEPAVCLVDELDLHLHPRFQQTIISFLTETFPNTQFIVTAHSPLIVQAAEDENANVILLKREGDHTVVVNTPVDVRNWRLDQIVTSELFGLESAYSKKLNKLQKQRDKILSKPSLSKTDHKKLEELEHQIGHPPLGEDQAEIQAETIIRQLADVLRNRVGLK